MAGGLIRLSEEYRERIAGRFSEAVLTVIADEKRFQSSIESLRASLAGGERLVPGEGISRAPLHYVSGFMPVMVGRDFEDRLIQIAELLIEFGADPSAHCEDEGPPAYEAAKRSHLRLAAFLASSAGSLASLQWSNSMGQNLLHYLSGSELLLVNGGKEVWSGVVSRSDAARYLAEVAEMNANQQDCFLRTPRDIAMMTGRQSVAVAIEEGVTRATESGLITHDPAATKPSLGEQGL